MKMKVEKKTDRTIQQIGTFYVVEKFGNQCCNDKGVRIEKCNGAYSCVCECGRWCTSSHKKIGEAVDEYLEMCEAESRELPPIFSYPETKLLLEYSNRKD